MKKILLFAVFLLLMTGCGKQNTSDSTDTNNVSSQNDEKIALISEKISAALTSHEMLDYITNAAIDQLPENIDKKQIPKNGTEHTTTLYAFKNVAFMFVNQPNMDNPIPDLQIEENKMWNGVLAKIKGNGGWVPLFPISHFSIIKDNDEGIMYEEYYAYNPVGMFTEDGKLYLDIADDHAYPDGDPNLIRFVTQDGIHWEQEGCYYMDKTNYITRNGSGNQIGIDRYQIGKNDFCEYKD